MKKKINALAMKYFERKRLGRTLYDEDVRMIGAEEQVGAEEQDSRQGAEAIGADVMGQERQEENGGDGQAGRCGAVPEDLLAIRKLLPELVSLHPISLVFLPVGVATHLSSVYCAPAGAKAPGIGPNWANALLGSFPDLGCAGDSFMMPLTLADGDSDMTSSWLNPKQTAASNAEDKLVRLALNLNYKSNLHITLNKGQTRTTPFGFSCVAVCTRFNIHNLSSHLRATCDCGLPFWIR